jgi:RNA polymerase sigma factor (sigma-70 family)
MERVKITSMIEQDLRISEVIAGEHVEDLLQEVFFELVRANRLLMPVEFVTGWLYSVARNRITDLFRKKKPVNFTDVAFENEEGELLGFEDFLISSDAGPEEELLRKMLLNELEAALAELPKKQREVFVAHELEGRSFKELAEETGTNLYTLIARKRYAVQRLRARLQKIHEEFTRK